MLIPKTASTYMVRNSSCNIYIIRSMKIDNYTVKLTYFFLNKNTHTGHSIDECIVKLEGIQHWIEI